MTIDLSAAAAHLTARDPVLARIIDEVGFPIFRHNPNLFGALVDSIIGQQISVHAASAIRRRIAALMPDGATLTPDGILARSVEDLRGAGLSRTKVGYLLDLATKVHDGTVDLEHLSALDDEAIVAELMKVKGIGRWTVEMFLIFSLHRPDVLPVGDLGFRTAIQRQYGLEQLPTADEIRRLAEPWVPYRSVATWYLWRSLRNEPLNRP